MRLRCARCGGPHVLRDWFHLQDACPTCGHEFERDDAFFGSYMLGLWLVLFALFVVCMTFLLVKNASPSASVVPPLVAAIIAAIVVPLAFYPFSKTLWVAIEVALVSDDPVAEAEALLASIRAPAKPGDDKSGPDDRHGG